ncbi:MAG: hypothetical protein HKN39_06405 [Flavobacteriales bacterium]|nr:hypothetical protein [Flavobacteriales bacterium]
MMYFDHPLTNKVQALSDQIDDRKEFHSAAEGVLLEMAASPEFLDGVVQYNLDRPEFLEHNWSLYEIPCLWIADTGDFQMKFHVFLPMEKFEAGIAGSCIHHHNNYLLTTLAVCGSGYETFIFEKDGQFDPDKGDIELRVRENFVQKEGTMTLVDSWEPHVVFSPKEMTTTLTLWSPDAKRSTDKLRHNPVLKAFKKPLRFMIHAFGMDKKMGIASAKTYQFYEHDGKFEAIEEGEYFAPTKAAKGPEIDDDYVRTIFAFLKAMNYQNTEYLGELAEKDSTPAVWKKWALKYVVRDLILPATSSAEINIPGKILRKESILKAQEAILT